MYTGDYEQTGGYLNFHDLSSTTTFVLVSIYFFGFSSIYFISSFFFLFFFLSFSHLDFLGQREHNPDEGDRDWCHSSQCFVKQEVGPLSLPYWLYYKTYTSLTSPLHLNPTLSFSSLLFANYYSDDVVFKDSESSGNKHYIVVEYANIYPSPSSCLSSFIPSLSPPCVPLTLFVGEETSTWSKFQIRNTSLKRTTCGYQ